MRLAWIAAGVGSVSVLSSFSFGTFQFQTVLTDSTGGLLANGGIGTLTTVKQIVLQDGKKVAAIIDDGDFNTALVYNQQGVGGTYARIATQTVTPPFDVLGGGTFGSFSNLSFGTDRLVFSATYGGGVPSGAFGYQVGSVTGYKILADGDLLAPSGTFANNLQVGVTANLNGTALIGGGTGTSQAILRGDFGGPSGAILLVTDAGGLVDKFNDNSLTRGRKKVFSLDAGNPVGVFLAQDPNNLNKRLITQAKLDGTGLGATRFTEGQSTFTFGPNTGQYDVKPEQLMGATSTGTIFAATLSSAQGSAPALVAGTNDYAIIYKDSAAGNPVLVKQFGDPNDSVKAEVTGTGRAAFTVGNKVYYYDSSLTQAQELPGIISNDLSHTVTTISLTAAPMINDSGTVAFYATLSDGQKALLAWTPGASDLTEVAKTNSPIFLDGSLSSVTLTAFFSVGLNGGPSFDFDPLKDGLSEDNHIAFGINYYITDPEVTTNAVVIASIPEPATGLVMLGAVGGLMLRRRRK